MSPPLPSGPPPNFPLEPEDQGQILVNVPPDLEELLTQIPPTPGFTLNDKDDIFEIFPDQSGEIPPILILEDRKGSPPVQENHQSFAGYILDRTKNDPEVGPIALSGGGPDLSEAYFGNRERIKAKLDSRPGATYIDLTFENTSTDRKLHINSADTLKDGVTADSRETANAIRGLQNIGRPDLMSVLPKAGANQVYDYEPLYQALRPFFIKLNKPWTKGDSPKTARDPNEIGWIKIPPRDAK